MKEFDVAGGTITGRDHLGRGNLLVGKNNQDVFRYSKTDQAIIAIVCDGCSDSAKSEVGANLGAQLLLAAIEQQLRRTPVLAQDDVPFPFWERVRQDVVAQLRVLALQLAGWSGSLSQVVSEYFLFTVVGAVLTKKMSSIISIGDGVAFLNGEMIRIGPFPGNAPPYLGYALVDSSIDAELLHFQTHRTVLTKDVRSLLVGSDGVADLAEVSGRTIPGKSELVGPLSQFWEQSRFFQPDQIRRRLSLVNSEVVSHDRSTGKPVREPGLLPDDTTFVVIRRTT
ncbi:MAG TPA: protein phosphatase 2C domain-containing protein [Candidatus Andersenbacteria bacterium]|nr:protein phosphatase 2C domain-containing protein [Candidatus Andersenbacteria bacterium]